MDELDPTQPWQINEADERNEERYLWPEEWGNTATMGSVYAPEVDPSSMTPEEVLKSFWGYDSFRAQQREIITSILEGHDTLGLLPTGGGKSITFQVPGLMLPGITLVITPLISLMKDQVDHLIHRGIKAAAIHSGMSRPRIRQTLENCIYGRYKFLYVSPERLSSPDFLNRLDELEVSLLVVDECHCVCQWGYDFRPSYLNIITLRDLLPPTPILALTATATPEVATDICRRLGFAEGYRTFKTSFFRSNLSYSIRFAENKERMMLHILSRVPGTCIVYCRSRELCKTTAQTINHNGITATYFHAGLTPKERELRQNSWMRGEVRVMVATNAFGMGIDKPDVRLVLHIAMPNSLEEYFQEAGRAGRDGHKAYAVIITGRYDVPTLRRRYQDAFPDREYIYQVYDSMCNYLGIGEGEGFQRSYVFDPERFIINFRMHPIQTMSAIDIMQVAGWLDYHRDDSHSRLMILYTREELYAEHVGHDDLFRALLRLYTGLFADYVFIEETDIAQHLGSTAEEVYDMLTRLTHMGVLHYIPQAHTPRVYFHIRREDTRYLNLPRYAYELRRDRLGERLRYSINYIQSNDVCRSRLLLNYFGEMPERSCGMCDVCLQRDAEGLRRYIVVDTERIVRALLQTDGQKSIPIERVLMALPFKQDESLLALRYISETKGFYSINGGDIIPQD